MIRILYPIFLLASLFWSKNKHIWVFGCRKGYLENTKYFFEHANNYPNIDCVWLANSNEEANYIIDKGYISVNKNSFKGYLYSIKAGFTFITTGFTDVNRLLSLSSKIVHFYHGTPIKKIFYDGGYQPMRLFKGSLMKPLNNFLWKLLLSRIVCYYSSNSFEQKIFCRATSLPISKSRVFGSPRYDFIREMNIKFKDHPIKNKYNKIILYAPTWRADGFDKNIFSFTVEEIRRFHSYLMKNNTLFIIKPHPNTNKDDYETITSKLLVQDSCVFYTDLSLSDIHELYAISDVLVTDYSSAFYDFFALGRNTVFFAPDWQKYFYEDRGVYDYFMETIQNYAAMTLDELITSLENEIPLPEFLSDVATEINSLNDCCKAIANDIFETYDIKAC